MEYPDIIEQFTMLGWAVLLGAFVGIYSGIFELLRKLMRPGKTLQLVFDLLFWFSTAVVVFFVSVWLCGGYARFHFIAAVFLGWGAYSVSLGVLIGKINERIVIALFKLKTLLKKHLMPVFKRLFDKILCLFAISAKKFNIFTLSSKNIEKNPCISQDDTI